MHETPFQSFEVANVEMVAPMREGKKTKLPMVSLEDVKTVIKAGYSEGWGRVLDFRMNKDCAGLGYHSQNVKKLMPKTVEGQVLPLSDIFASSRHLVDGQICAM